ncbi:MAG TPA: hypothetical protein DCE74_12205 [Porphyromonadaceae bacterium]|jgi:hypothetical protein|nr:hypothetical protein [Porphyromonadaceae bacterium]
MAKYRITVKMHKNANGMVIDKGMSVEMVTMAPNLMSGPAADQLNAIFKGVYGVDLKAMNALSVGYLDVKRIG